MTGNTKHVFFNTEDAEHAEFNGDNSLIKTAWFDMDNGFDTAHEPFAG
jgi:hypothetical protein